MLILTDRLKRQPPRVSGIDWANPLAKNLVLSFGGTDFRSRAPWGMAWNAWGSIGSQTIGPNGEFARNLNNSAIGLQGSDKRHILQQEWTVWARVYPGATNIGYLVCQADTTTSTRTGIWISTYWQCFKGGAQGSSAAYVVDATSWQDMGFTFAAGSSSVANTIYKNGAALGAGWVLSPGTASLDAPWLIGARWTTVGSSLGFANSGMRIACLHMWERTLSANEIKALSDNPCHLYEQESTRLVFLGSGAAASGAITGTAALTFGAGSSTLTGTGTLAGTAALTFGAGSSTLTGTASLSGSSNLVFSNTGTITGAGALAGTSALAFAGSATLLGTGALAGSSDITFTPTGDLTNAGGASQITGTAALTFTGSATLTGTGALAGTASLSFSNTGTLTGTGALAGTSALTSAGSGTLTGTGALSGTVALAFDGTGVLGGLGELAGTASMVFGGIARPEGVTANAGLRTLTLTGAGT